LGDVVKAEDQKEFDALLAQLCAGYNVPATDERKQAYWTGLQKLHIAAFQRVVEYALGEHAPEKFPTTRAIWDLHKILRRQAPPAATEATPAPDVTPFAAFANRRLLAFLKTSGAASDASLKEMIAAKVRLTDQAREILLETPISAEDFAKQLRNEWARLWIRRPWGEIEADRRKLCLDPHYGWGEPTPRLIPREHRE
jgi:hypothetical protein